MIKKYSDNNLNFARLCLMLFCAIFVYFASMLFINQNESASASEWKNHCSSLDSFTTKLVENKTYFIVDTPEKLAYFTTVTASYNIMVVKNLDMSAYQWTPICKTSTFTGIFDGGGCEISGLTMSNTYRDKYVTGLFGKIGDGAKIRNVVLKNVKILSLDKNADFTGAIAGQVVSGSATIENCSVSGGITVSTTSSSNFAVGGILGYSSNKVIITGCQNNINIKVKKSSDNDLNVGGIVGKNYNYNSTIKACINYGNIQGVDYDAYQKTIFAGGIAGYCNSSISECANYGDVLSGSDYSQGVSEDYSWVDTAYAGGIVGYCSSNTENCYNRANITARAKRYQEFSEVLINQDKLEVHDHLHHFSWHEQGFFSCNLSSPYKEYMNAYAGGICGYASSVSNSFSIGDCIGGYNHKTQYFSCSFNYTAKNGFSLKCNDTQGVNWSFNHSNNYANGISGEGAPVYNSYYSGNFYDSYVSPYVSNLTNNQSSEEFKCFTAGTGYANYEFSNTWKFEYDKNGSKPQMTLNSGYSSSYNSSTQVTTYTYDVTLSLVDCLNRDKNLNTVNTNPVTFTSTTVNKGTSKTTSQLSSSSFYSTLGKDNWAYDSKINDGYPYIKSLYHQN